MPIQKKRRRNSFEPKSLAGYRFKLYEISVILHGIGSI
jgi:hypothetical protein